ncbi:hypothetical protein [Oscillatoria sp. FACHB-1406]|uniref:hypothetical protein n=1 Tax=Oscillatoria sp. FACHB-1406 TaxID=2692846 RepID=UPI0016841595|nr:hypothetical protein [Oscillatoria sp. FACHB-1406]MBD2577770.1 hypothetical protein [Oscillatoria sp. FACHB-1406]
MAVNSHNSQNRPTPNIQQRVEGILEEARINRREYFQLVTLFLSDLSVTEEERRLLNIVFDRLQNSQIQWGD